MTLLEVLTERAIAIGSGCTTVGAPASTTSSILADDGSGPTRTEHVNDFKARVDTEEP